MKQCYKRIVAIVLCVVVMTCAVVTPALAADLPDGHEVCDSYYDLYYGDVIAYLNDNGIIVEVEPSTVSTYSGIGTALTLKSLGGVIAAGSGTLLPGGLPILAFLVMLGVTIYTVDGICDSVTEIYYLLSEETRAEMDAIASSGEDSFSLSQTAIDELTAAMNAVFYTSDGTFENIGITFDPTNMLQFDVESQYIYNGVVPDGIYIHDLTSTPVQLTGTSLQVSLVDALFTATDVDKCLYIYNTATGIGAYYSDGTDLAFDHDVQMKISVPTVETITDAVDGYVYHNLGFWIEFICTNRVNGEYCADHGDTYTCTHIGDDSATYIQFINTGDSALDGYNLHSRQFISDNVWRYYREVALDGSDYVDLTDTALERLLSSSVFSISQDSAIAVTPDDTLYLPTAEALEDVNLITQEGIQTGVFTTTVDEPAADDEAWGTDLGLGLVELLQLLLTNIKELLVEWFGEISRAITGFFDTIKNGIFVYFDKNSLGFYHPFFDFMQSLWSALPAPVTNFILFGVACFMFFALIKMFW